MAQNYVIFISCNLRGCSDITTSMFNCWFFSYIEFNEFLCGIFGENVNTIYQMLKKDSE